MNYSNIISTFTWSYSRLTTFEDCPYRFLLSYIKPQDDTHLFFSDYGLFMHKVIEKYLTGELKHDELGRYYLLNFQKEIVGRAPNKKIFQSYFQQGLSYLNEHCFPYQTPCAVEHRVDFFIDDIPFTGVIDCVAEDNGDLVILDHKSRALKPRTNGKKIRRSDLELDDYLRQLYLYSIPVYLEYHRYPKRLEFNCFRTGQLISEPFSEHALEEAKTWAKRTVKQITDNEDWSPDMEYWKCRYLCGFHDQCEYHLMSRR